MYLHLSTYLGTQICNSGFLPIFRSKFVWIYTNLIFAIPQAAYLSGGSLDTRDTFSSDWHSLVALILNSWLYLKLYSIPSWTSNPLLNEILENIHQNSSDCQDHSFVILNSFFFISDIKEVKWDTDYKSKLRDVTSYTHKNKMCKHCLFQTDRWTYNHWVAAPT